MGIFDFILKPIQSLLGEVLGFLTGTDFDDQDESAGALVNKQSNIDPIPVIYGRRKVGGTRVFLSTGGNKNEYLYMVIVLSEGPVDAVEEIYINDELWLKDEAVVSGTKYSGLITHGIALGGDSQVYISMLSGADVTWGANHTLSGIAYVALRFKYDQDKFGGIPDVKCVVRGKKVYDPRKDDTSSAYDSSLGVSTHRANLVSTWEWSSNPALCLRDYLTNARYGKGLNNALIDVDSFADAADFLDTTETKHTESVTANGSYAIGATSLALAGLFTWLQRGDFLQFAGDSTLYELADSQYGAGTVTLANGLTVAVSDGATVTFKQKIYECNAVIDTGKKLFDNVKTMLQGMRGLMPYSNGVYSLIIDKDENSTFNLTPDNITSEINVQTQGKSKKYNKVTVKFTNPDANWQADSVTYDIDASTIATEDNGEELAKTVTMNTITNKYSAKDIAKIICLASRKNELSCKVRATSEALAVAVADVVTLEHPSFGWVDNGVTDARKKFRVIAMQLLDDGEVDLTLQEYDNSIYPWVAEDEINSGVDTNLPDPFDVTAPTGLTVTAGNELADDGTVNVFIDISFTAAVDSFLDYYEITVIDQTADPDVIVHYEELDYDLNITKLRVNGLAANITYLVSLRGVSSIGAKSATVSDTVSTSPDTTPPTMPTDLAASGGLNQIKVSWTNPSEADYAYTIIYRNTSAGAGFLPIATVSGGRGQKSIFVDQPLSDDETLYYKIRVVDFSGNGLTETAAGPVSATTDSAAAVVLTPRQAHGYVYYSNPQASAPNTPTATAYDFEAAPDDNPISGLDPEYDSATPSTAGWSINPFPPDQDTASSSHPYWVCRYYAYEDTTHGGTTSVDFSSPFESTVFEGLVTFQNLNTELSTPSVGLVTQIDGGLITTGEIDLANDAGMAIRQGKSSSTDTSDGFYLGRGGTNNPLFYMSSNSNSRFLYYDTDNGNLHTQKIKATELTIEKADGTVVFDTNEFDGTYIKAATIDTAQIASLAVETVKINDNAVTIPEGADGTDGSNTAVNPSWTEVDNGGTSARVTLSWSSDDERPEALICSGFVSFLGGSAGAGTMQVRMRAEGGAGNLFTVANTVGQSFGSGEGGAVVTTGHFALTNQTSPLEVFIECNASASGAVRQIGGFGFFVLGAKK